MKPRPSPARPAVPPSSEAALFTRTGPHEFTASELTAGPWNPQAQHGSPVAALVVHCLERIPEAAPLPISRVTLELVRPVPVGELTVRSRVRRPGKRVQLLEAEVAHGGETVALASAWCLSGDGRGIPSADAPTIRPPRATGHGLELRPLGSNGFHAWAVEADVVSGDFAIPGSGSGWIRLRVPVVAGYEISPAERAVVTADFGNAFSSTVDPRTVSFINPDLTVYLAGMPRGEWVGLHSTTFNRNGGYGFAESVLYDELGVVGRSMQSLLFQSRR